LPQEKLSLSLRPTGYSTGQLFYLVSINYTLEHRKSNFLSVADALSRLPMDVNLFDFFYKTIPDDSLVNLEAVMEATSADPLLSKIADYTLNG